LWEDRRGIHTFTCSTVVGAMRAAAKFASLFSEKDLATKYEVVADEIISGMKKHLYSPELGRFLRSLHSVADGKYEPDGTVDASLFGSFYFGSFAADDEMVINSMAAIEKHLSVPGGIARFENDSYMRTSPDMVGNAWFLCSLWMAEYYIAAAKNRSDLEKAVAIFRQIAGQACPSGVLPEQIDPMTGDHTSVAPLTWSHSTYVAAIQNYLTKVRHLR
jgi:GH15 family glucan-1,4-alpha-glucosidase